MKFSYSELHKLIKSMENEKDVVIVKGTGKVFTSGGDAKSIASSSKKVVLDGYRNSFRMCELISVYKKPFVALVDGLALGGAAFFSLPAKYSVATERTAFAMPETAIGYFNDAGSSYHLPKLGNNLAFYIALTGARVKGFDLKKVGLATHYVESSKLDNLEKRLIVCKTHEEVQRILDSFSSDPSDSQTELDELLPKINNCFGGATVEDIYERLQQDGSEWALKTIKTLNRMSPTSLKVTHRNYVLGKTSSLRDCLKREFQLVIHHINGSDLEEGVRAMLLEKDNKPRWNPKTVQEVTEEHVARFFKPSQGGDELAFETDVQSKL